MLWRWVVLGIAVFALSCCGVVQAQDESSKELLTVAEESNFESTCTSEAVEVMIDLLVKRGPHLAEYQYGETVEGRPMTAVICANPPYKMGQKDERAIALVIGNIHSGECCGKEALLMLLREIAKDPSHPWLENMVVVIVPNYNADGNDRMAKDNRRGQDGPVNGMGQRETVEGYDLNRDFIKLDSREGRAMVKLINDLNPHMFIDCHTTNGSRHQYQLTYDIPHNPACAEPIRKMLRDEMMPAITEKLWSRDIKTFYYGNFNREYSKWETYGYEPRYSTEYLGLRGRLGILSEAYSYISFRDRIHATHAFVTECLNYLDANRDEIRKLLAEAEQNWIDQFSTKETIELPLRAEVTAFEKPFGVYGYKDDAPNVYQVEFVSNYVPVINKRVPRAYIIPGELSRIVERLRAHGIRVDEMKEAWTGEVEVSTVTAIDRAQRPFQKHFLTNLTTETKMESRSFPAGSFRVDLNQPLGRLAMYVLEPESADSFATWNYLDDYLGEGKEFPIVRVNP